MERVFVVGSSKNKFNRFLERKWQHLSYTCRKSENGGQKVFDETIIKFLNKQYVERLLIITYNCIALFTCCINSALNTRHYSHCSTNPHQLRQLA